jgi:hypothetical protein
LQLGFPKPFSSKRLPAWVLGIPLKKNGMLWMDQNVWISSTSYFGLFWGEQQRTMGFEGHLGERIPSRQ